MKSECVCVCASASASANIYYRMQYCGFIYLKKKMKIILFYIRFLGNTDFVMVTI
jgi:hypothetical protein